MNVSYIVKRYVTGIWDNYKCSVVSGMTDSESARTSAVHCAVSRVVLNQWCCEIQCVSGRR